jgi:hypothetical protein
VSAEGLAGYCTHSSCVRETQLCAACLPARLEMER